MAIVRSKLNNRATSIPWHSMSTIIPVILSGGAGTRLWPLSRALQPKQLLPLVSQRTLLQDTLLRLEGLGGRLGPAIVICNEAHRFLVAEQLREVGAGRAAIVLEPAGRNTAPAVAVAALQALRTSGADPLLLVLPADHVVVDAAALLGAIDAASRAAAGGRLVTFGVVPTRPETGYGYLRHGTREDGWAAIEQFVEKPDRAAAESYLASGRYLWNSGMFVFSARTYLDELARHAPAIVEACTRALNGARADEDFLRLGASFLDCPADSIDYAVMEKTPRAAVVPLDAGWSDVGSWAALHDVLDKDADGNVLRGDVMTEGCRDCYIASRGRLVAGVGLDGVIVVETEDAVLVVARAHSQRVKRIVDRLEAQGRREARQAGEGPDVPV